MKNAQKIKQSIRLRRVRRARARIFGTKERPRLVIYKSLKHLYAQAINDEKGVTLVAASDFDLKTSRKGGNRTPSGVSLLPKSRTPAEMAKKIGGLVAKKLQEKKINKVIFDRRGYKYHGIIKTFADAVREGGIKF